MAPLGVPLVRSNHLATLFALSLTTALVPHAGAEDAVAPLLVEVQPNPVGTDFGNEWVEFANPTPAPVALDGLFLTDHDACNPDGTGTVEDYHWPLSGTVPALGRLQVMLPATCLKLVNTGDELELVGPEGLVLQSVSYGAGRDLPAPDSGESLAACELAANLHGGWSVADGSPGAPNPAC